MTDKQQQLTQCLTVLQYLIFLYLSHAGGYVKRHSIFSYLRRFYDITDRQLRREVLTMILAGIPIATNHKDGYALTTDITGSVADLRAKARALYDRATALERAKEKWNGVDAQAVLFRLE